MEILNGSSGGLLPIWLLGAPLLLGIVEWMRTPKGDSTTTRDTGSVYAARSPNPSMRAAV